MGFSQNDKDKESEDLKSNDLSSLPAEQLGHNGGSIATSYFLIWTIISFVGIILCFIHTEQEHIWLFTGPLPEDAQSFEAKTIISVISTIIGGCVTATLLKTVKTTSFTLIKYRGAHFSQLATLIGGFSIGTIPMLSAGGGWLSIIATILLLIISAVTKQLAVVSMGVESVNITGIENLYTRNYTTCVPTNFASDYSRNLHVFSLIALNSIKNGNDSYTDEYYDRSIPLGIKGITSFDRVLPFANVSCKFVPVEKTFDVVSPIMSPIQSTINPIYPDAWSGVMSMVFDPSLDYDKRKAVNCTIVVGHATANTLCDGSCSTRRTSDITPYQDTNYGVQNFMQGLFTMFTPKSSHLNIIQSWLSGGDLETYNLLRDAIPGQTLEKVEERTAILATVIGRIICDRNGNKPYTDVTRFDSFYSLRDHYVYRVLWKWPFWIIAALLLISWALCMFTMWLTPESRVMSVEWLLSQYIAKEKWGYMSGNELVKIHEGSLFQVIDQKADEDIGNIVILKTDIQNDARNRRVIHKKKYQ